MMSNSMRNKYSKRSIKHNTLWLAWYGVNIQRWHELENILYSEADQSLPCPAGNGGWEKNMTIGKRKTKSPVLPEILQKNASSITII